MTDRIHALTVVLDEPIRTDDMEPLIAAIRQLRGVADVQTHVHGVDALYAEQRVRREIHRKLWAVLQDE